MTCVAMTRGYGGGGGYLGVGLGLASRMQPTSHITSSPLPPGLLLRSEKLLLSEYSLVSPQLRETQSQPSLPNTNYERANKTPKSALSLLVQTPRLPAFLGPLPTRLPGVLVE